MCQGALCICNQGATPTPLTISSQQIRSIGGMPVATVMDFAPVANLAPFGVCQQLTKAASTIMGSGWAALVWEPVGGRLLTTQIYDHQSNLSQAGIPLMVLDAWEHAYYLQYENRKADFFQAVWPVWNWRDISTRFEIARKVNITLDGASG